MKDLYKLHWAIHSRVTYAVQNWSQWENLWPAAKQ